MKRVFLIVLDSVGAGAAPDAEVFGDAGAHTLLSCARSAEFHIPNLTAMGLGNVEGLDFIGKTAAPTGAYGRLQERSMGKDTTIGHWELAGVVSECALPTYPDGFPEEVLEPFCKATGRGVLCNKPYSGTDVIRDYGEQHVKTGDLIVYTSADSVFQIAAHEAVVPVEQLYEYCRMARGILTGKHCVGRVIARPFAGEHPFARTANRHDFSLQPPAKTVLDAIIEAGKTVIGVGKIHDIFAGQGITEKTHTHGNRHGMDVTMQYARTDFQGLCFVNLVDFDMLYGHRQDADGYAKALSEFDAWLSDFLSKMGENDMVLITADHGCDPSDSHTDHTREYVPLLIWGKNVTPTDLGTGATFANVAATVADALNVPYNCQGESYLKRIGKEGAK